MHFLHDIINILSCSLIFIFFTFLLRGDKLCFTYITRQTSFIYFLLQQKKVTKKICSVFKLFRYAMPDVVTAPSAIIKIFSQTSYPSPLNAARSSTDSLRSPTPERLASRRSLLGNFLPSLTSLSLVNRSLFAGLTALIFLILLIFFHS